LLFSGGITAARGHYGDNVGVSAITRLIDTSETGGPAAGVHRNKPVVVASTNAVYGCPLFAPSSNRKTGQVKCAK
jgi:hypothetical protein